MTVFAALLRAINVGGSGKLAMSELRSLCEAAGFEDVETYIQSGNVLLSSRLSEAKVKAKLERALGEKLGAPAHAFVRTTSELESIVEHNPFAEEPGNRVLVYLLDAAPPKSAFSKLVVPGSERVEPRGREVFVHYPDGSGRSKLKLPLTAPCTSRNMNTIVKLATLARRRDGSA